LKDFVESVDAKHKDEDSEFVKEFEVLFELKKILL